LINIYYLLLFVLSLERAEKALDCVIWCVKSFINAKSKIFLS